MYRNIQLFISLLMGFFFIAYIIGLKKNIYKVEKVWVFFAIAYLISVTMIQ
jgi:hypothetical protein